MIKQIKNYGRHLFLCSVVLLLAACNGNGSGSGDGSTTRFTVSTSSTSGGILSPSTQTVDSGDSTNLTVTPDSGYAIDLVTGCGGSLSGTTYTTGSITSDCTVSASFVRTFTVTASASVGGNISPASTTVITGSTTALTLTPDSGYVIDSVSGCGGSLSGSTYTTGSITTDCAVSASFLRTFTVTASAGTGGNISPARTTVNTGSTATLTLT
ncbi:MAG: hypothetical protein P8098_20665, partial [Candidatus Thiodiazotropha sp.]